MKQHSIYLTIFFIGLTLKCVFGQELRFSQIPEDYQLYARDKTDSAEVMISGILSKESSNWIWRARFWAHEPQTDLALLEKGFHVAYADVAGLFGNEKALKIWDEFYDLMTSEYELNSKVTLEGMSRGGLIVFNWANRNAEKVSSIYVDAPVCDFKSWPAGKGIGKGSPNAWKNCLKQYDFSENIASQKVPILSVVGDADEVVPVSENTALVEKRLKELGWEMKTIHKSGLGHHPHSLENPKRIGDFILKNTKGQ
ncbi:MAG: pimeloyl-ACP methyl ester carboxylesterase [Cyclobacteriaceae bacterium]|jgi:pimeloyl-ACP methyl ester carboxylesterase